VSRTSCGSSCSAGKPLLASMGGRSDGRAAPPTTATIIIDGSAARAVIGFSADGRAAGGPRAKGIFQNYDVIWGACAAAAAPGSGSRSQVAARALSSRRDWRAEKWIISSYLFRAPSLKFVAALLADWIPGGWRGGGALSPSVSYAAGCVRRATLALGRLNSNPILMASCCCWCWCCFCCCRRLCAQRKTIRRRPGARKSGRAARNQIGGINIDG
jgi:hypothetical protein